MKAGAFVAALLGVAIVALSTLLFAAGRPQVPERFGRAAVVVQRPDAPWSSADAIALADRLRAIDGVADAVPDRDFYAQVVVDGRPRPARCARTAGPAPSSTTTGSGPERHRAATARSRWPGSRPARR